jgi:lysyl-tRNA synthetase, class II
MNESTPVPAADENQIVADRRAKLAELRRRGPAFPNDFHRGQLAGDLHSQYGRSNKRRSRSR